MATALAHPVRRTVAAFGTAAAAALALAMAPAQADAQVLAVTVTNPGPQHYAEFDQVSIQLSASGGTAPYTWSATGLFQLQIDSSTGLIHGLARAGTYNVTATATASVGGSGSTSFTIYVPMECRHC